MELNLAGRVHVILKNMGEAAVDVEAGMLRVAVTQFA